MKIIEKIDLKTILIIVLICVIFFLRMCSGDGENNPKKVITVDGKKYEVIKHIVDTVIVPTTQTVYKEGKTIYKDKPVYISIPSNIDTNEILKDYYAKYHYSDTLRLQDSLGYITVNDTISENKILNRVFFSKVNKTTIKETIIVEPLPKNQLYIGGVGGFDRVNVVNFLGPTLVLKTKKDKMFSIGVGYSNNKTISYQLGMYWKIKLKK